jgi:hypothetical protein
MREEAAKPLKSRGCIASSMSVDPMAIQYKFAAWVLVVMDLGYAC